MALRPIAVCVLFAACAHPHAPKEAAERAPDEAAPNATTTPAVPAPEAVAPAPKGGAVDFTRDVRPILESRCQPCHFEGGRMYDRLPFDRAETIHQLGPKLFTRIKAEEERAVIRQFLSQGQ